MSKRAYITKEIETKLFVKSRRRCCMCAILEGDWNEKEVQIAHISRDASDSSYENLVLLCLRHHNLYDTKFKQTKNYTPSEIKKYKNKMIQSIDKWDRFPNQIISTNQFSGALFNSKYKNYSSSPSNNLTEGYKSENPYFIASALISGTKKSLHNFYEKEYISNQISELGKVRVKGLGECSNNQHHCFIHISDKMEWKWDILVFKYMYEKWNLVSDFSFKMQKCNDPKTIYIHGESTSVFAIEYVSGSGTGFYSKSMAFYRIGLNGVKPLFSFPTYGYVVGWETAFIQRQVSCQLLYKPTKIKQGAKLKILLEVEYKSDISDKYNGIPLFNIKEELVLVWDTDLQMFIPGEECKVNFNYVENLLGNNIQDILKENYDVIKNLAFNGTKKQKEFLNYLFNKLFNTTNIKDIEKILNNK